MLLIDFLVIVAQEELAKLHEEEERNDRKQRMMDMAEPEPLPPFNPIKRKRTERGKIVGTQDVGDNVAPFVSPDDHLLPGMLEPNPLKIKLELNKNIKNEGGNNDDGDEDYDVPRKQKTEIGKTEVGSGIKNGQKKKQRKPEIDENEPIPQPGFPQKFRRLIQEKAGDELVKEEDIVLVIQKKLCQTDLQDHQNRLSIPSNQIRNGFLNQEDSSFLEYRDEAGHCNCITVDIIEPSSLANVIGLRRWEMKKSGGKASSVSYVLTGSWKGIKERNMLKVGAFVQLWAVYIKGKLCLILVDLDKQD